MRINRVNLRAAGKWFGLAIVCFGVASCTTTTTTTGGKKKTAKSKEYFSESAYGVKASPKVTDGNNVPKGGGRYLVGRPYKVAGKTYVPRPNPSYDKVGLASWYGSAFHGRRTANGEVYDQYDLTAAHPTMPLPSYARVTNLDNGSSVIVRVNDRGPFHKGRIIDLSNTTAELLDMKGTGTAKVRVQYIGPAQMDGHDKAFLMASYNGKGGRLPQFAPDGLTATPGVMVASNDVPTPVDPESQMPAAPTLVPVPATATAFNNTAVQTAGADPFQQFVILPDTGPQIVERPQQSASIMSAPASRLSAYSAPDSDANETPFRAVLVRNDGLTEEAIKAFALKKRIAVN